MSVRTRFAPSPTGYLHVGGARTALFSWLFAKRSQGTFILRIEDTDRERSTQESIDAILQGMAWLGLEYDEGPIYQTERFDRYQEVIEQLLHDGHAYRCFCSKERLAALREQQLSAKQKPKYDGHCLKYPPEDRDVPHVIRFNNPKSGSVRINDRIRGTIEVANDQLDDLIIARSDGTPTYNLTVVVDDWDMGITHVIRGDDHINNTPRQINILQALNAPVPEYAHVTMILGGDGARLSKRHGAVSVMQYREQGILPKALLNYLVRLGWSHGDQEIFSLDEMCALFSLEECNKSPSSFNHEKLLWLNQHYLSHSPLTEVLPELEWHLSRAGLNISDGPDLDTLLQVQKERHNTLVSLVEESRPFYQEFDEYDSKAAKKHLRSVALEPLTHLKTKLEDLTDWSRESLHHCVQLTAEELNIGMGKVGQPLRVALTGMSASPSIDLTLELLGQETTLSRIQRALDYIQARQQSNSN
ncbi:MAG TPA: glutamate--tRNA ligase [Gammaproteobacteria bacterium]|nr:glutamate--tRNA ligase [Gammaproteobacteria bacterium]